MIHCKCPSCGWSYFAVNAFAVDCSQCGHHFECGDYFEPRVVSKDELLAAQREHWRALHAFAFSDDWACATRCQWFAKWQAEIPNINCDCRKHWRDLVEAMPPTFASRAAFFRWTVDAHNAVNLRLGKPVMTYEDALALYSPDGQGF